MYIENMNNVDYAIIFWKKNNDDDCYFLKNNNGSILTGNVLAEMDRQAEKYEAESGFACRVISLCSVHVVSTNNPMTKKDYELIAEAIRLNTDSQNKDYLHLFQFLPYLSEKLAKNNQKFNSQKFLTACGVENELNRKYCETHANTSLELIKKNGKDWWYCEDCKE